MKQREILTRNRVEGQRSKSQKIDNFSKKLKVGINAQKGAKRCKTHFKRVRAASTAYIRRIKATEPAQRAEEFVGDGAREAGGGASPGQKS